MGLVATIGLVSALVGTGASIAQGRKAERAQEEQAEKVSAQNAAKEVASRRQALREERVRRARILAESQASGVGDSSSAISGVGMSGTLAAEQSSAIGGAAAAAESMSSSQQDVVSAQSRQQLFSNVAGLGSTVFNAAGGFGAIDNMFSNKKET